MKFFKKILSSNATSNRIDWIDNMKGIGMILVVLGHVTTNETTLGYVYAFHMPLFFFVAGYVLSLSDPQYKTVKRIRSVLLPYAVFAILSLCYWALFERHFRDQTDIPLSVPVLNIFVAQVTNHGYVQNNVLWFLPCYFIVTMLFILIYKNCRNIWYQAPIILGVVSVGVFFSRLFSLRPPWMLDSAMVSLFFVAAGFYFSRVWKGTPPSLPIRIILSAACFAAFFAVASFNEFTSIAYNEYGNPILFFVAALLGIMGTFFLSHFRNQLLSYIGTTSIILMCIHEPLKRIILKIMVIALGLDSDGFKNNLGYSLLGTICIIAVSLPVIFLFNKYLFFLTGQPFQRNKQIAKS